MDCGPVADGAGASLATHRPARRATPQPRNPATPRPRTPGAPAPSSHAAAALAGRCAKPCAPGVRSARRQRARPASRQTGHAGGRPKNAIDPRARRPIQWPSRRGRRLSFTHHGITRCKLESCASCCSWRARPALAGVVGKEMGRRLGQQMVVDNRAGAGGAIGVNVVAKAPADGHTLLAGASSVMVMLPAVSRRKLPYDADADFAPIGRISASPFLLVVGGHSGITSLAELLAAARADPGRISYASAGPATNPHMLGEMLSLLSGTVLRHVPYRGPGAAQRALPRGRGGAQGGGGGGRMGGGKWGVGGGAGSPGLGARPGVPTVGELGYPQLQLLGWTALYAPRAVPPAVLALLQETLQQTLLSP